MEGTIALGSVEDPNLNWNFTVLQHYLQFKALATVQQRVLFDRQGI